MKAFATYHPAAVLHGGVHLEKEIEKDLKRIEWKRLTPPDRKLRRGASGALAVDTEYDAAGQLLTVGVAGGSYAAAQEPNGSARWPGFLREHIRAATHLRGHNIAGDIDQLLKAGFPIKEKWLRGIDVEDSLLLARMSDEEKGRGGYKLESLMLGEFNFSPWKKATDDKFREVPDASLWTPKERMERCRLDAWASYTLAERYLELVPHDPAVFIHRVALTLHRLGLAGAAVDLKRFEKLGQQWVLEAKRAKDLLVKVAQRAGMAEFRPTNDNDIRELLYERLGFQVAARTKKSGLPSVDKITLKALENSPAVKLLLEFNKADTLASTWYGREEEEHTGVRQPSVRELLVKVDNRSEIALLHFWLNPVGARTGRRSSGGGDEGTPQSRNSQNWPLLARSVVRSRWPKGKIGANDYQSLEPILYGWITQDEKLLAFFLEGGGYIEIAREVLRRKVKKGTDEYKYVKSLVLGVFYNMGDWKAAYELWHKHNIRLSNDWDTHMDETAKKKRAVIRLFPKLERYIHRQIREVITTQQIVAPDGYIRHLPHHGEPTWGDQKGYKRYWGHIQNIAVNFPVQHMASMVTGSALMDTETALLSEHGISLRDWHMLLLKNPVALPCSVIFNEVHDEVTVDYRPKTYKKDRAIVEETMVKVPSLRKMMPTFNIPLKVDPKVGPVWGVSDE